MKVKSLVWMGIKTDSFQKMEQFLQDVMGLQQTHHAHDFVVFQLPNKDKCDFPPILAKRSVISFNLSMA
jgi:hypothetical protein